MKIIGITGGVGAGKSTILNLLKELRPCECVMADDVAKELMQYKMPLSEYAVNLFGSESYNDDFSLNTEHIASLMYQNSELKNKWTSVVHPAVKEEILARINKAKKQDEIKYFFLEAALLLEEKYNLICDEIWYVYTDEKIRIERIMSNRGYSYEKAKSIIANQKSHEEFVAGCDWIVDNGVGIYETKAQLENKLEEIERM